MSPLTRVAADTCRRVPQPLPETPLCSAVDSLRGTVDCMLSALSGAHGGWEVGRMEWVGRTGRKYGWGERGWVVRGVRILSAISPDPLAAPQPQRGGRGASPATGGASGGAGGAGVSSGGASGSSGSPSVSCAPVAQRVAQWQAFVRTSQVRSGW